MRQLGRVLAVLSVLSLVGGGLFAATRTAPAGASLTVVHLTSTLSLSTGDTLSETKYIWEGPSTSPVIQMLGVQYATLDHIAIEVASGYHATAAIQLDDDTPRGGPFNNSLSNITIGTPGVTGRFDYGLRWNGSVNGDSNTMTNISVYGAAVAGVSLNDPQATANTFRSLFTFDSPIGFQSVAGGTVQCETCGFTNSSDVDIELTQGGGLILTGVNSKGSRSFARVVAGAGGAGLTVLGGRWEWGASASGATITGTNSGYRMYVRLTDFIVTPLDGTTHGSISGFAATEKFLSNTAGIA